MEKLNKKEKHDHKLTTILKAGIFSILMLAPMLSVLARTMYVICNPNAKDSYSQKQVTNITRVLNTDYLLPNSTYILSDIPDSAFNLEIEFDYISVDFNTWFNTIDKQYYKFAIDRFSQNQFRIYAWYKNEIQEDVRKGFLRFYEDKSLYLPITFSLVNYNNVLNVADVNLNLLTYSYDSLDNAFEYSINNIKNQDLYNWTENTGIYNAINNMVIGLGANDVVSILLTYWSILTAIYIVFDIIIAVFVKLTHLINE